jgi:hypothetical protein
MIQRTRRNGADLAVHTRRLWTFFRGADAAPRATPAALRTTRFAPLVFSWLAGRGAAATRLDPHDAASPRQLQARLAALFADDRLFAERLDQR